MVLSRRLLVFSVLGSMCGFATAQRLPAGVTPQHYALMLTPDLRKARFVGSETIDLTLEAETKTITLNAAEIEFVSVKSSIVGTPQGQDAVVTLDPAKEQATFTFAQPLPRGSVSLKIEYNGVLNSKLRGFYLSKTKVRNYAVTQFEATDARRAFPSFDEPALKATFDIALTVDAADMVISNTNMISDEPAAVAGKHTVAFATTPKMSTYLVAFLVGDFQCSEGKEDGVPIRACSTPDKVGLTKFAVDAAKFVLHYYDHYFGIKYPMPKLDMVAIPDFEAGAMENFGCITYREIDLLVDERSGAIPAKKEVAETIAHEMAHQWFGDMVTMQWWDNLWLNEGFATWMESKPVAKWHPEWRYPEDVAGDLDGVMNVDAERTTRPIRARAETPAEINEMFDDISYGKGGAVIAMVENYVGEEVFRQGVHAYLEAHLYGNASAEDFWNTQTRTSRMPVDRIMESFVAQPGVPLVTVGEAADGRPIVGQSRFLLGGVDANGGSTAKQAWTVPLCFTGGECQLLSPGKPRPITAPKGGFVYANAGDKGYYRTVYSARQLAFIEAHAESNLSVPERIGLLGDRWALMHGGQGTVAEFLDLVLALKGDPDVSVLDSALGKMGSIGSRIATDEERGRLDAVVREQFGPVYAALGEPGRHESYDRTEMRGTLFEALGEAKDPAVLTRAASMTEDLFAGKKTENPAIVDAAVTVTVAAGDTALYEKLLAVAKNATDPDLQADGLHTLARFKAPALVARTLEFAASGEVRNQDDWEIFAILLDQRETRQQTWEWIQNHWPEIEARATINSGARIVEATSAFCTVKQRDEVAAFFAEHPVESSERTLAKSIDSINGCIHLRETQEPSLRRWLDAHAK